jgi:hypothetical protein
MITSTLLFTFNAAESILSISLSKHKPNLRQPITPAGKLLQFSFRCKNNDTSKILNTKTKPKLCLPLKMITDSCKKPTEISQLEN